MRVMAADAAEFSPASARVKHSPDRMYISPGDGNYMTAGLLRTVTAGTDFVHRPGKEKGVLARMSIMTPAAAGIQSHRVIIFLGEFRLFMALKTEVRAVADKEPFDVRLMDVMTGGAHAFRNRAMDVSPIETSFFMAVIA
jgi:hypothetical protein